MKWRVVKHMVFYIEEAYRIPVCELAGVQYAVSVVYGWLGTHAIVHAYCIHRYTHAYVHTCAHTYIRMYIRMCMHTYIPTYRHSYIHAYTMVHLCC